MKPWSEDAVGEVEAAFITGMSVGELAAHPDLAVPGSQGYGREACERLGLERHKQTNPPGYWLSVAQAAGVFGVSRQAVYAMQPPLP